MQPSEPRPKIVSVPAPRGLIEAGEKLMREKAAVPTEPGWYWATWRLIKSREIVKVFDSFGELMASMSARTPALALCNFTDWSARLTDPGIQQEGG